jgi:hypothetical protein
MKRAIGSLVFLFMLFGLFPLHADAAESEVKGIFVDGFYGGLVGALVGTAIMAFTDHPKDHLNNIAIGAGIGAIAGTAYGIARTSRAFAEIHDGRLTLQAPTIRLKSDPSAKGIPPLWSADLLKVPF